MTVIYPQFRPKRAAEKRNVRPAVNILRSMSRLLVKRRHLECNRREFLVNWSRLRRELSRTPEYQTTRKAVRERAGGMCERCGQPGTIMHHNRQVSWEPQHALDPKVCEWVCNDCHKEEHPWLT